MSCALIHNQNGSSPDAVDLDLEVEEEKHQVGKEPPAYWPSRDGKVVVSNLTCKYAPQLDPVLKDVSFEIGPSEKVSVCSTWKRCR